MRNTITEMNNTLEGMNSRLEEAEDLNQQFGSRDNRKLQMRAAKKKKY